MLTNYQLTPLEAWIENLYRDLGIVVPQQLTIIDLASRMNIWVYFLDMESKGMERNGLVSININRKMPPRKQWEDFLHELCHILRHAGNQITMPTPYMNWQEQDAANFVLYAAIPTFMLRGRILPRIDSELTAYLAEEFHVSIQLAQQRVDQIQRRVLQGTCEQVTIQLIKSQQRMADPSNWSSETRQIMDKLYRQIEAKRGIRHG